MNSRQRRKEAAIKHNECLELDESMCHLQIAIKKKHGVTIRIYRCQDPAIMRKQLSEMQSVFDSDSITTENKNRPSSSNAKRVALIGMGISLLGAR